MLFGHQNDDTSQPAATNMPSSGTNPLAVDPATGASLPVAPQTGASTPSAPLVTPPEPSVLNQPPTPAPSADDTTTAPVVEAPMPFPDDTAPLISMPTPPANVPADAAEAKAAEMPSIPMEASAGTEPSPTAPEESAGPTPTDTSAVTTDALLTLKQQALAELSPLIDQLDQTPKERFRTIMMMIQSTDNQSLIQSAYDAAEKITDEKARAQALLDIINEINYFAQQNAAS